MFEPTPSPLSKRPSTSAFTLVELVIVILILGVLAGVAVPQLYHASEEAADNSLRQTLTIVRDAIDLYVIEHGTLPGSQNGKQGRFRRDLEPYLQSGEFPAAPLGPRAGRNSIAMNGNGDPLHGQPDPSEAWHYDFVSGEFILNFSGLSSDGVTQYDEF